MIKNVPETFKQNCKKDVVKYREYIVINGTEVDIKGKLSDTAYKDTTFFGKFNLKMLQFETENDIDYKKKEFTYYKEVGGEAIKIGKFIVTEVKDSDTFESVNVTAYDYGLKFANPYTTNLDFGSKNITMLKVAQDICNSCNVELENTSLPNGDFIVDKNQFVNGEQYGDVVCAIALENGMFATVNSNDKLEFIFKNETDEIIEDYVELDDKRDAQPITSVLVAPSEELATAGAVMKDETLIEQYGEHWLKIYDNAFAYSTTKCQQLVTAIFNQVKGFGYSSFKSEYAFLPYMGLGDTIKFRNKNGDLIDSIILRYDTDYDSMTIEAPSIISASVDYELASTPEEVAKKAWVKVNQADGEIELLTSKTTDLEEKTSSLRIDVDEIKGEIGDIADITISADGTGILTLNDINESEPIYIKVYPTTIDDISYLYPSDDLYPEDTLYPLERKIIFHNKTTNKDIEYLLPLDLLYLNSSTYDEFVLDYENQECYIMKRVKYDKTLENIAVGNDLSSASLSLNLTNMQSNITYIQTSTYRIIEKYSTAEDAITLEKYNGNTWDKVDTLYRYTTSEQVNLKEYILPFDFGTVTSIYSTQLDNVNNYIQVQKLGNKVALTTAERIDYTYPTITLTEGDYEVSVRGQDNAYMFIRLMAKNLYTSQFATKVELKSSITQTKNEITLDVTGKIDTIDEDLNAKIDLKVDTKNLISEINASAGVIRLNSNRFSMTSDNSSISEDGEATFKKANIGGFVTNTTSFTKDLSGLYKYTAFDVNFLRYVLLGYNNLSQDSLTKNIMDYNNDGNLTSADLLAIRQIVLGQITNTKNVTGKVSINSNDPKNCFRITDSSNNVAVAIGLGGINSNAITAQNIVVSDTTSTAASSSNFVTLNGIDGSVRATTITQTSLAENKKNFKKYSGALDEIANIDIYKYNLKNEKNTDKKHLGFVIGDKFNYSQEITTQNNDQVDLYSMISLCMQGLKEQQEIINKLEQRIADLENK